MKRILLSMTVLVMGYYGTTQASYESDEIKELTLKMTDVHGGLDNWKNNASIYFETNLVALNGMFPEYNERVTIDPISRKTYIDFPYGDTVRGQIAHDGDKAWAIGKRSGLEMAPPRFTCWRNFYLSNLPFVMHDEGVSVSGLKEVTIPGKGIDGYSVKLTFGESTGDSSNDFYLLYINKENYQLEAAEYNMTYASMLPPGMESLPASVLTFEQYETVNGLMMPTVYKVHWQKSMEHIITAEFSNWSTEKSFDYSRMEMPADAQLDQSRPK